METKHCRDCGLEMRASRAEALCVGCIADLENDKLAQLGARVLEILALTELPAGFDAPDKIGAVRNAARSLGLLGEKGGRS